MSTGIVWFRQDLRLADNPALFHAAKQSTNLILVYIHSADEAGEWAPGGASRWWLHHSLKSLQTDIRQHGGKLELRHGSSLQHLTDIINQFQADTVYFNRLYEPALASRDHQVVDALKKIGVQCQIYNGSLLFKPEAIATQSGTPFRVYTPYWKKCQTLLPQQSPLPVPRHLKHSKRSKLSLKLPDLNLLAKVKWYKEIEQTWQTGASNAHDKLDQFCEQALFNYAIERDRPDHAGTSSLSPHLHFGEISPAQILWRLRIAESESPAGKLHSVETYKKELIWREFAYSILHHFPNSAHMPLNERYRDFPYRNKPADGLRAWQTGCTGYPLVDAGMRQLWKTGWMHNRVRMLVASFLTKNMLLSWRHGTHWFWDTLVDADLASNSFNWQWAAGCGADAAPYFRIFNPVTQSKKFDPNGSYIKRWIPELQRLPDRYIHEPWKTPMPVQINNNIVIGTHYPAPIVDLKKSRQLALDRYNTLLKNKI